MPREMPAAGLAAALTMPLMAAPSGRHIDIEDGRGLDLVHVVPQTVTYKGHKALKLVGAGGDYNGEQVALVNNLDFKDGTRTTAGRACGLRRRACMIRTPTSRPAPGRT